MIVGFSSAVHLKSPSVGSSGNQVPTNSLLGSLAYSDVPNRISPVRNVAELNDFNKLDIAIEYVSDTMLILKLKGSDGLVRGFNMSLS